MKLLKTSRGRHLANNMKRLLFILLFLLTFIPIETSASHIAGGDISYNCIGPNQYQIVLNLFRDCAGINASATANINITSSCGQNLTLTLNLTNPGGTEISQLCASSIINSTCNNGNLPGMQRYTYEGIVTLPSLCNSWVFTWEECCRNVAVVNLVNGGSQSTTVQAQLFSANQSCNNSPTFNSQPIPYVCANQPVVYNYGIYESDGDSMVYSLAEALGNGNPLNYTTGYTPTDPIPGLILNTTTGVITFTPTTLGSYVVVLKIEEYNDVGQIIGTVFRDIQFVVQTCPNIVPAPTAGQVTNVTGGATSTGPYSLELCEGGTFTFTAIYTDADPTNILTLSTNVQAVLPGSIITTSGTNPLTAQITWTAGPNSAGSNNDFSISIDDGSCPIPAIQVYYYHLEIIDATSAGPDRKICGPQNATLNASGGSVFTWYDINNVLVPVGPNFSCNPCANPIVHPVSSVDYIVESNLSSACHNRDTAHVDVVPDFNIDITTNIISACQFQSVQLFVDTAIAGNPPGNYDILWSPATTLNNAAGHNPVSTNTTSGIKKYTVTVTGPGGCTKKDSIQYSISNLVSPVVDATATSIGNSTICYGDSIQLSAIISPTVPLACNYTLNMYDIGRNGWNGGTLQIFQDGIPYGTYAAIDSVKTVVLNFNYGATITFQYTPGNNEWQNTYQFISPDGTVLNSGGPNIPSGNIYTSTISCNGFFVPPNYFNYTYLWTPSSIISTPTKRDPKTLASGSIRYYVTVTNNNGGCTGKDSVDINVILPTENLYLSFAVTSGYSGNDSTLIEGCSTGTLTLTRTGSLVNSVIIQIDRTGTANSGFDYVAPVASVNFPIGVATTSINISSIADLLNEGTETIIFTTRRPSASICSYPPQVLKVYIKDQTAINVNLSNDTIVSCNANITLISNPNGGTPPYSYNWSNGTTSQSNPVTPSVTTLYNVTVSDMCNDFIYKDSVRVNVVAVSPTSIASNDTTIYCNSNISIFTTGLIGTKPFYYKWGNGSIDSVLNISPLIGVNTYNVTITDVCLSGYDTQEIIVNVIPDSTNYITIKSRIIKGQVGLNNIAESCGDIELTFSRKNVTGLPATSFTFTLTGTATNGIDYTLQNGIINFSANSISETIHILSISDLVNDNFENISITQILNPADCFTVSSFDIVISELAPVSVSANSSSIKCTNNSTVSAIAIGDIAPYTFVWNNGFTGSSFVTSDLASTFMVIGSSSCSAIKDTVYIQVIRAIYKELKVVPSADKDTVYCKGSSVNLSSIIFNGEAPYTYLWTDDTSAIGNTSNIMVNPISSLNNYTLSVTDQCGKIDSDISLYVIYDSMEVSMSPDTIICAGQEVRLYAYARKGVPPYKYNWSNNIDNDTFLKIDTPSIFSIKVTDSCNESIIDSVILNVSGIRADFEFSYISDTEVQFENNSIGNITKSMWQIDEDLYSTNNLLYIYKDFVEKDVTLTVHDNIGCSDQYTSTILPGYSLYIPNTFTPNGDYLNELFGAEGVGITEYEMFIFDRWGIQLKHSTDINDKWDGRFSGKDLPQDTYIYIVSASGARGETGKVIKKGTISITR